MRPPKERQEADPRGTEDLATSIEEAERFFEALWRDYVALTPRMSKIRELFLRDNPNLANDHVAFRTFGCEPIGLGRLERHFLEFGYRPFAAYSFDDKKLDAWGYVPPDDALPRIFLSELRVSQLSSEARAIIDRLCAAIDVARVDDRSVLYAGRLWATPSWEDYRRLVAESEYAAWLAAFGMHANHFTVSVNSLAHPTTLEGVIERVESAGFPLNEAGGKIKGSPAVLLEQAATLADRIRLRFSDGSEHEIPSCYYEFARRYPQSDGNLYPGFVAASADSLFESTHIASMPRGEARGEDPK